LGRDQLRAGSKETNNDGTGSKETMMGSKETSRQQGNRQQGNKQ
jgi:hypothetical protein